ncbi:MAG TPA: hypothetical protein EYP46_00120 [Hadesarchaea archaeon]|nr:hypothetical protein [Hadesarchaea archaeon]
MLIWPSDHTVNLSGHSELRFWVKTPENLKVMIQQENRHGAKQVAWISDYGWDGTNNWQEIAIPASTFLGLNMSRIFCPFSITASTGAEFYVDDVQWC